MDNIRKNLSHPLLHLLLIAFLGTFVYSSTMNSPFVSDDISYIKKNPAIRDLKHFTEPSSINTADIVQPFSKDIFKRRLVSFLTFALNYKLNGLDVWGYHAVNISLHILNAFLLYLLLSLSFFTPKMKNSLLKDKAGTIAFLFALVFVSHPIQTQAVNYISQRFVLLATFFYLLSLTAFVRSRMSSTTAVSCLLYALALVSSAVGMMAKETVFTLPVVIVLYEFMFFEGPPTRRILRTFPILLTMAIIPYIQFQFVSDMDHALRTYSSEYTRHDYLLTQFAVIVTYITMLFLPLNQNFDHDYPLYSSFLEPMVFLSFLLLLIIFCLSVFLYYRSRVTHHAFRLIAFGVFWFFITISVSSSIVPTSNLIFEYRAYLPSAGFFAAVLTTAFVFIVRFKNPKSRNVAMLGLVVIPLALSLATCARNRVWQTETRLWEDAVRKAPRNARAQNALGYAYINENLFDKAIEHLQIAVRLNPVYADAHDNLGLAYSAKGMTVKAMEHIQIAMRLRPDYKDAVIERTMQHYKAVIKQDPDNVDAYNDLGVVYFSKGMTDEALKYYHAALERNSDYSNVYFNLGEAYFSKGLVDKSIENYRAFLNYRPDYADAHYYIGIAYEAKGMVGKAEEHYRRALELRPDYEEARRRLNVIQE
jgi:tetratricopeptide (TPR) repeat protein